MEHEPDREKGRHTGSILSIDHYKPRGYIRDDNPDIPRDKNVHFFFSDVENSVAFRPSEGELVEFDLEINNAQKEGRTPYTARSIRRTMEKGMVIYVNPKVDENGNYRCKIVSSGNVTYSHKSDQINFRQGDYVQFTIGRHNDREIAMALDRLTPCVGKIDKVEEDIIIIKPENADKSIAASRKEVQYKGRHSDDKTDNKRPLYRVFKKGDPVAFLLSPDGQHAFCVKKEYPLRLFADLGDEMAMLKSLAEKALPEDWNYSKPLPGNPHPILWNYLFNTFAKLQKEDAQANGDQKKIAEGQLSERNSFKRIKVFNTGLVAGSDSVRYHCIYAVFEENSEKEQGRPEWKLIGFCTPGSKLNHPRL